MTATGPQVRNMVLTRWRQDVTQYLTLAQVRAAACAPLCCVLDVCILECSTGSADTLVGWPSDVQQCHLIQPNFSNIWPAELLPD